MKKIKFISALLAVIMLITALGAPVFAADLVIDDYYKTVYESEKAKVDTMKLVYNSDEYGYQMYFDELSGEFAIRDKKTGEYTFSNPYDIAANYKMPSGAEKIRYSLMSQIMLRYKDNVSNTSYYMSSYEHAALLGDQISYTQLSNGIRVEYALGTVESKRLLPRWIEASRFEEKILSVLDSKSSEMTKDEKFIYDNLVTSHYSYKDQTDELNASLVDGWRKTYPCLANNKEMKIYTLAVDRNAILKQIEALIRKYCPEYTYEELEYDHELTGYEGNEKEPALFRLAIEYTFDEHGFRASIPAKSVRYNETNYTLESITPLPYFGCSSVKSSGTKTKNGGYIFIPDGSGTLLDYYNADGSIKKGIQGTPVYGTDFGYDNLSSTSANQEVTRLPVFGLTEDYSITTTTERSNAPAKSETVSYKRGYFGIIESGESFAYITASLGDMAWVNYASPAESEYNTVYVSFSAKQTDTVSLGSSLGQASSISKSMDTKYTGDYAIRYILLSDPDLAKKSGETSYEPSYIGMAMAYRDYLERVGTLSRLTAEETSSGVPLYIQSFGSLDIDSTFLSIPVKKTIPLTTFDDVITMSEKLSEGGIKNQKFILSGFANGTIEFAQYPTFVKWNKSVGGKKGLSKLISYAGENGIDVFPNFDFANVTSAVGSSFSYKKHAAQTMGGRYVTKRSYDPVFQIMMKFGRANIVSPSAFMTLYEKFAKKYQKYEVGNISVLTLGTDLNSDFNMDRPLTREDSKEYTTFLLNRIKQDNNKVIASSGNAYTLPYITDLIEVPMDNSRFAISSQSVPFTGMVLHGYKNFAGTAVNMAGDVKYEILKSIENGSALYFILSYQNTNELKNTYTDISDYYSVDFTTWYSDVIKYYNMVNDEMKDLQNAVITGHNYLTAFRLSADDAYILFDQLTSAEKDYEEKKAAYYEAVKYTDKLIADGRQAGDALADEAAKKTAFEAAEKHLTSVKQLVGVNNVGNAVSVTYTSGKGETTFYINYNSFDVTVYVDGKAVVLAANSFINAKNAEGKTFAPQGFEAVTAQTPTTKGAANFSKLYETLEKALASGSSSQIARAKENIELSLSAMATNSTDIVKVTMADGKTMLVNYTTGSVIVKVSDTRYELIAARSYIKID